MKKIFYQLEIQSGDDPSILVPQHVECSEADFPENYEFALSRAYQGNVTVEDIPDNRPLHEIQSDKEAELSAACNAAIVAGMDVETTQGTEHFELTEVDQINLTTALGAVDAGASGHPYHSTRSLCRMFSADEIRTVSAAAVAHVLYHRTLCNHLLTWVRRAETAEELEGISYTAEGLPEDLAANMAQVLSTDGGGADV